MKRSLYIRTIIGYLLYGVIGFIILSTFTQYATLDYMKRREAQNLYRESAMISSSYAINYYDEKITLTDLQNQMHAIATYLDGEIWMIDANNHLLFNSADSTVMLMATEGKYDTLDDFNVKDFGNRYYQTGNFYHAFTEDTLTVFSPVTINYKVRGYILIHKNLSNVYRDATPFTNITFYTMALYFLCGILFIAWLIYSVYRPIKKISTSALAYAKGDFTKKLEVHSNDELGILAGTLNYMATELDTLEEDQRKFVSNVSHDFRSPLTSIKGYVEAMLDGTIPVEMQEKYLNIILFETDRLNKLTKSILDLNQFGRHGGIRLDYADFDINQMIRNTLMTFEGTCEKKGISFEVILTGRELFVHADMTKIQQVIYNLIDNAIKFSHHNSSIKIETVLKNEKVIISVKDSGIGIPADSMKKIWERFYKTDLSRGKDKKGTGLGLAIVKEIITAHKENINCVSTEGVGTEFFFTLSLATKEIEK